MLYDLHMEWVLTNRGNVGLVATLQVDHVTTRCPRQRPPLDRLSIGLKTIMTWLPNGGIG